MGHSISNIFGCSDMSQELSFIMAVHLLSRF